MTHWFMTRLFRHQQRISLQNYYELVQSIEAEIEKEKQYITRVFIISLLSIIICVAFFLNELFSPTGLNKKEIGSAIAGSLGGVLGWISTTGDKLQSYQDVLVDIKKRFGHYKEVVSGEDFKSMAIDILKNYKLA